MVSITMVSTTAVHVPTKIANGCPWRSTK